MFKPTAQSVQGYIFDLKKFAIHDGPGIRTTVFFKGCPLNCAWCHNPESRRKLPEPVAEGQTRRRHYSSFETDPSMIGTEVTAAEVMQEVKKDIPYYDESGGGVTFSGGEPLMQPDFLLAMLEGAQQEEIHSAVDTTGYAKPETVKAVAAHADLFLYDLKLMDDDRHKEFTGVSNKLILENLRLLNDLGKEVMIRMPVVPGVNSDDENIDAMLHFISPLRVINSIALLPYHAMGEGKKKKIGIAAESTFEKPSDELMQSIRDRFVQEGFNAGIGG